MRFPALAMVAVIVARPLASVLALRPANLTVAPASAAFFPRRLVGTVTVNVKAVDFARFTELLPRVAREHGIRLYEVSPSDESLESVFSYLVAT